LVNTLLAGVVGAMLAVGMIFLIEYLDDTIKTPEEVMQATNLPLLGLIARIEDDAAGVPYSAREARSPTAEAFRSLRTNLQFSGVDKPLRTLLVTSPGPREGKSTVAANLGVVMAQGGHRVTLLDADMRRPRIHRLLGVQNRVGLSDLFTRSPVQINGALRPWRMEKLALLTSGGLPPNPAELLASDRMTQILDLVAGQSDFVIIDSPPAGAVTDPVVLAPHVDGVILVVEPKRTQLLSAVRVVEDLRRAGANVLGLVFNNVSIGRTGYYNGYYSGYYYQYVYTYGDDGHGKGKAKRKRTKAKTRGEALTRE
jgi:capsular exopolysaccharide synthesis family protein